MSNDVNVNDELNNVEETAEVAATETVETPVAEVVAEAPKAPKAPEAPAAPAEFDWSAIGKKHEAYAPADRQRLEDIYDKTLSSIGDHEVLDGLVVGLTSREVIVNKIGRASCRERV